MGSCFEAVRVNVNIREMAKSKKKWVALSTDQLNLESTNQASSCKMVGDHVIHCVEPIPDKDWVGETWGLYFSDYEDELMELLEQDTEKYITKHEEEIFDTNCTEVDICNCPAKDKTPEVREPIESGSLEFSEEILETLSEFNYNQEDPIKYLVSNNQHALDTKFTVNTLAVLQCPTTVKPLDIQPPIELTHETGSEIGTLGVVHIMEWKEEESQKFWKPHKHEGQGLFEMANTFSVKTYICTEENDSTSPEIPGPKLPDNALHLQFQVGHCCQLENVEKENKWDWMRSGERSTGRAKHGLSIFW